MSASKNTKQTIVKSKDIAILLAFMFGMFSWIYTYRKDAKKFWANAGLSLVTIGYWTVLVAWPWAIVDAIRRPRSFYGRKKVQKFPYIILGILMLIYLIGVSLMFGTLKELDKQEADAQAEQQRLASDPITSQGVYLALNKHRASTGAVALAVLPELTTAAKQKCDDMAIGNYFEYNNPTTGKDSNSYIVDNQGDNYYKQYVSSIFYGHSTQTATDTVNAAVTSQASNLSNPNYNSVGLHVCESSDKSTKYIVGMLAEKSEKPKPAPVTNNYYTSPRSTYTPTYSSSTTTRCTVQEYTYFNDTITCNSY